MQEAAFWDYLQYERRYSRHTSTAYLKDLQQFFSFAEQRYDLTEWQDVKSIHLRSWVVDLMQEKINASTIARKISTLRTYHKFLLQSKRIKNKAFPKVLLPKKAERLPVYIEKEQMETLQDFANFEDGFAGWRDYLLLELLYTTGMRRSELIALEWSAIQWDTKTLQVLGKGNKERWIPFGNELRITLESYKKIWEDTFPDQSEDYILLTDKGVQMYPKFVYNKVKRYLALVSTQSQKSPHVLRHSFATHLSNNGADLNAIKELLGHSSLAATQVYTHNSIEQLKKAYEQAHPKAKDL